MPGKKVLFEVTAEVNAEALISQLAAGKVAYLITEGTCIMFRILKTGQDSSSDFIDIAIRRPEESLYKRKFQNPTEFWPWLRSEKDTFGALIRGLRRALIGARPALSPELLAQRFKTDLPLEFM